MWAHSAELNIITPPLMPTPLSFAVFRASEEERKMWVGKGIVGNMEWEQNFASYFPKK